MTKAKAIKEFENLYHGFFFIPCYMKKFNFLSECVGINAKDFNNLFYFRINPDLLNLYNVYGISPSLDKTCI